MLDVDTCLKAVIALEASDLHLKVPAQPTIRLHGTLQPLEATEPLTPEDTQQILQHMLTEEKLEEFKADNEVDFAYSVPGLARFRVNAFLQRGSVSLVCRAIPAEIKTIEELLLPPVLSGDRRRGARDHPAHRHHRLRQVHHAGGDHRPDQQPVRQAHRHDRGPGRVPPPRQEVDHQPARGGRRHGLVRPGPAARAAPGPDVILIGEMRDEETVSTALSAAETGHLVLSTIHTVDAAESVNRIIDFFPIEEQKQVRAMLAGTLKGVVSQRLVPRPDGHGRVATCEVLRMTGRVRDMIMNPDETGNLPKAIEEGAYYGMQTFDQALLAHVQAGRVSMEDAIKFATRPHDFKLLVSSDGQRSTSIEHVLAESENGSA